jgi:putative NADH-flavin reductase
VKVRLIGATGQIGYALTTALAKTEHRISVLVRDANRLVFPGRVNIMESRTFDVVAFRKALTNIDPVIYGVGLPAQFLFEEAQFNCVNRGVVEQFLAELRGSGTSNLTHISMYEVFEAQAGVIRESYPMAGERAMTPYFRAMTQAACLMIRFAAEHGLQLTTIHPVSPADPLGASLNVTTMDLQRFGR